MGNLVTNKYFNTWNKDVPFPLGSKTVTAEDAFYNIDGTPNKAFDLDYEKYVEL